MMSVATANTTINSTSEKPWSGWRRGAGCRFPALDSVAVCLLEVTDVGILSLAPWRSVGSEREYFHSAPRAGIGITVGVAPRVDRNDAAADVGAVPAGGRGRAGNEGVETFLIGREAADVELEEFEGLLQVRDLHGCSLALGAAQLAHDAGADQANEQREDCQHDEELDEGKAS